MTAVVKVIYDPQHQTAYTVSIRDNHLFLDIHVKQLPYDLDSVVSMIQDDLILKKSYRVVFNYSSCPKTVKEYYPFKERMLKLLQRKEPVLDGWLEIVTLHNSNGKHPDFTAYDDPKGFNKVSNYFASVLNTTVTRIQAIELCKKLISPK